MKARMLMLVTMVTIGNSIYAQDKTIAYNPESVSVDQKKSRKKQKEKKVKEKPGGGVHKVYTDMTFDELIVAKDRKLAQKDYEATLKYLEQLLKVCTDVDKTALLMIEYADLLFDQGELSKASKVYTEFTHLYPGHSKHEYALYRAVMCSFYTTLSSDRDQTATETTLSLAKNFLDNATYTTYTQEVTDIQKQCFKKVVQSELDICNFYLNQGSYKAVEQRIAKLKTDFVPKLPDIEADILAIELTLAEKKEATQVAHQKAVTQKTKHAARRF